MTDKTMYTKNPFQVIHSCGANHRCKVTAHTLHTHQMLFKVANFLSCGALICWWPGRRPGSDDAPPLASLLLQESPGPVGDKVGIAQRQMQDMGRGGGCHGHSQWDMPGGGGAWLASLRSARHSWWQGVCRHWQKAATCRLGSVALTPLWLLYLDWCHPCHADSIQVTHPATNWSGLSSVAICLSMLSFPAGSNKQVWSTPVSSSSLHSTNWPDIFLLILPTLPSTLPTVDLHLVCFRPL